MITIIASQCLFGARAGDFLLAMTVSDRIVSGPVCTVIVRMTDVLVCLLATCQSQCKTPWGYPEKACVVIATKYAHAMSVVGRRVNA